MEQSQAAAAAVQVGEEQMTADDDDSSSTYVRTIKRIISRTQSAGQTRRPLSPLMILERNRNFGSQMSVETGNFFTIHNPEVRSLYSLNEFPSTSTATRANNNFETSFIVDCEAEFSSSDNQQFEFSLPSAEDQTKAPPFAKRYFSYSDSASNRQQQADQDFGHDRLSGGQSESSEPDLNVKWSWKNLKREFKLTHSESLFHLYQAKLQHSFFVALLILNIIFNIGAIISYALSKYHEMNLCKCLKLTVLAPCP